MEETRGANGCGSTRSNRSSGLGPFHLHPSRTRINKALRAFLKRRSLTIVDLIWKFSFLMCLQLSVEDLI